MSASPRSDRLLAVGAALCLMIAAIAGAVALSTWREVQAITAEARAIAERAARCGLDAPIAPLRPLQPPLARPDALTSAGALTPALPTIAPLAPGDEGLALPTLLRAAILRLHGAELRASHLGDPRVLRPGSVHVLYLWAGWCAACKEEMPALRALFERRREWGEQVRFVAVQVDDHSDPADAYGAWAARMPAGALRLADRGQGAPLLAALRAASLYRGVLPTTLVLDCNRRIRWIRPARLAPEELGELEARLDALREEAATERCQRTWCGAGRCDPGEQGGRCSLDCAAEVGDPGEPAESGGAGDLGDPAPASPPPAERPASPPCPERCLRCTPEGRCIPRLLGAPEIAPDPPAPPTSRACGDGVCAREAGEASATCCQDCGCRPHEICLADTAGAFACRPRLKL